MNPRKFLLTAILFGSFSVIGQAKLRKMPANINHTSVNNFAPYISLDGNTLVYVADVDEDHLLTLCYSNRVGVNWQDPVIFPKSVNSRLNFLKGYGLSPDGKTLYISSRRENGMGGYDLYTSNFTGLIWTNAVNMLLPANSKSNEACASISIDNTMMFYMRCDKMDVNTAEDCKILMMTRKSNGLWSNPVELPASINTGNSQAPRIMGDGETLIFSSNKLKPNKGGMDLYMAKFINGQWSDPVPLDFANTTQDDEFVSATSIGRYLLKDAKGVHNNELIDIIFPQEIRPKGMMKVEGTISGLEDPASSFVTVFNLKDQTKTFSTKPAKDGTFVGYFKEGGIYDLSVDPPKDNYLFFSKRFDLTGESFPLLEKVTVPLKPATPGDDIGLDGITFKPSTAELAPSSNQELRRLTRLIQGNPDKFFSIMVTFNGYQKDSIQSNPDLTEVHIDSLKFPVKYKIDSLTVGIRDSVVVKRIYHNDRTLRQAKAIGDYLISQGVPASRISHSGKAVEEPIPENRKTKVHVTIP